MLNCYPEKRVLSDRMLSHPWLYTPSPPAYFMYLPPHAGAPQSTSRSRHNATIWTSRRTSCTSMSPSRRTPRPRTMVTKLSLTTSSSGTRRWETSDTSIEASWIWGTSVTVMASSWRSWTSDPTGSSKLDQVPNPISNPIYHAVSTISGLYG